MRRKVDMMNRPLKVMISQPMRGLTATQIEEARARAIVWAEDNGYQLINTWFKDEFESGIPDGVTNAGAYFLGKSISKLSSVDILYMSDGWEKARGCIFEHSIAIAYGTRVHYENPNSVKTDFVYSDLYVDKLHAQINEEHCKRLELEAKLHDEELNYKSMLADKIIKFENVKSEAAMWKKKYRETVDEVKRINDQLNALCKALFKMLP